MSAIRTINLDAVHAATVERVGDKVKLSFLAAGTTLASKVIAADKARALGDALGFIANDIELPAPRRTIEVGGNQGRGNPPACREERE